MCVSRPLPALDLSRRATSRWHAQLPAPSFVRTPERNRHRTRAHVWDHRQVDYLGSSGLFLAILSEPVNENQVRRARPLLIADACSRPNALDEECRKQGALPVRFGLAKLDLVESHRSDSVTTWRDTDA
jgi:hypothetical protein